MGSELWLGSETVVAECKFTPKHPEIFRYSEDHLKPKGILNEMVIVPNLISFDQYNLLGDYLVEELGYERENNFIEFAYDWRQDVRQSARELASLSMAGTYFRLLPSSHTVWAPWSAAITWKSWEEKRKLAVCC